MHINYIIISEITHIIHFIEFAPEFQVLNDDDTISCSSNVETSGGSSSMSMFEERALKK